MESMKFLTALRTALAGTLVVIGATMGFTGCSGQVTSSKVGSGTGTGSQQPGGSGSGGTTVATPGKGSGGTTVSTGAGTGGTTVSGGSGGAAGPPAGGVGTMPAPATAPATPGVLVLRRLNAAEYNNTVHDLLGTTLTPATGFPSDDLGDEFTTVGSALSLSPNYVKEYEDAAFSLMDDLFAAPAARQSAIVTCSVAATGTAGDTCARTIVTAFARKAFRRPATSTEIDSLMTPWTLAKTTAGATTTDGIKAALAAVLMSPYFIFKVETDPAGSTGVHRLTAYETATRLSYALWASMPDATLSAAADANQLSTDDQLKTQIDRMLADPRSAALMDQFAGAWLDFQSIEGHEADPTAFASFTPTVAHSMRLEARNFIQDFLSSTQPVTAMFTANFTYVDSTLAKQYGLPTTGSTPAADGTWKADTSSSQRAGLLTLGSFLTTTSLPNRTSPVKRGDFIFSRLLCGYIPPPPDNVSTGLAQDGSTSLRDTLAAHRASPTCAPCHNIMDPLGLGLENFDAIGQYRTMDGTFPVDASGQLSDGTPFNGAKQLGAALAKDARVTPCVTQKFMTYAIGRLMNQPDDANWANYLAQQAQTTDGSLGTIVRTVISSEAFRSRQPM